MREKYIFGHYYVVNGEIKIIDHIDNDIYNYYTKKYECSFKMNELIIKQKPSRDCFDFLIVYY